MRNSTFLRSKMSKMSFTMSQSIKIKGQDEEDIANETIMVWLLLATLIMALPTSINPTTIVLMILKRKMEMNKRVWEKCEEYRIAL